MWPTPSHEGLGKPLEERSHACSSSCFRHHGVPDAVADIADLRLRIPMGPGLRSINVAIAGSMVLGEAMRQTGRFTELS